MTVHRVALSATDEVHDLEAVAGLDEGFFPVRAGQDFEVPFNGHAFGEKFQVSQ